MAESNEENYELVYEGPWQIGGEAVWTEVPSDYTGPCSVVSINDFDSIVCAFPTWREAKCAAIYASKPDGGYGSMVIRACEAEAITHSSFLDWIGR